MNLLISYTWEFEKISKEKLKIISNESDRLFEEINLFQKHNYYKKIIETYTYNCLIHSSSKELCISATRYLFLFYFINDFKKIHSNNLQKIDRFFNSNIDRKKIYFAEPELDKAYQYLITSVNHSKRVLDSFLKAFRAMQWENQNKYSQIDMDTYIDYRQYYISIFPFLEIVKYFHFPSIDNELISNAEYSAVHCVIFANDLASLKLDKNHETLNSVCISSRALSSDTKGINEVQLLHEEKVNQFENHSKLIPHAYKKFLQRMIHGSHVSTTQLLKRYNA